MKRKVSSLVMLLFLAGISLTNAQNPGDSVFAGTQIHTVNLRFSQPGYWDTLTAYYNLGTEQYIPATVVLDGVAYDSVGVRFKGHSSYTHPNNKKPFRLAFDEYRSSQRWNSLKGIHLNNCWGDPSFMREKLHLDFCSDAGIAAPRAAYARLSINDTLWGFYSMVEHVDKTFLKTHYGKSSGDLFKAVDAFDPPESSQVYSDFSWYGDSASVYASRYELKTDGSTTAWPALLALIDTLHTSATPGTSLPKMINPFSLSRAFAADILFANLDSYLGSGRNFYAYWNPTGGLMEWIVWDTGLSFGAYQTGGSSLETMSVLYVVSPADRPLAGKVFETPTLQRSYLLTLDSVFTGYFSSTKLSPHIDSIASIIRSYVYEDPRKMYTNSQFETNLTSDVNAAGGAGQRKPGLKSFITKREASVHAQLAALGITSVDGSSTRELPATLSLSQNYPNPFNPTTTIAFTLPQAGNVRLEVYNLLGEHVRTLIDGHCSAGTHAITFDASPLSSGVHFYRLCAGALSRTMKMILVK